jgi:hypothetical protein
VFRIGGNTFYDRKNKNPMKIPEFKRSGIGLIAEFRGIPNVFPNQVPRINAFLNRSHRLQKNDMQNCLLLIIGGAN